MAKPVALVTGASSGIGLALARVLANRGHDLVVTARREAKLEALAAELTSGIGSDVRVDVIAVDLGKTKGPGGLFAAVADRGLNVDMLVNNAGAAVSGKFTDVPRAKALEVINLNVRALTELTRLFLPGMLERGRGRILNVASVAAFQAVPGMSVYGATKAFVLSLTEALSEELANTGVTVTALCPGITKTDMVIDTHQPLPDFLTSSAEEVAREGVAACMAGEVIRIPGPINQALVAWLQHQPRWLVRFFAGVASRTTFGG